MRADFATEERGIGTRDDELVAGIVQTADLEPKPGLPPTAAHLQRVLEATRQAPPRAVVVSSYQDARPARWLVQQLGGSVALLQLPATVAEQFTEVRTPI